jgi:acetoin utilization deacetylase AcuC-like enzyme
VTYPTDEYDRGKADGGIEARLAGHDRHFDAINGSLAKLAQEMHLQTLAVQRLGDQADAAAKTVLATASALKAAEEARRAQTEQRWSPIQKLLAVVAGVAAIVAIAVAIKALLG